MEIKQRLDAKCWTGKHKEGTKIKGGIRVNNCVPNEGVEEGLGQWARNAALAGALAVGSMGAHADVKDVPAGGHNLLPDIVAHVKFKVGDKEIVKDINLGSHYRSPGEAGEELKKFLDSKGIKFYEYSLERVKPTNKTISQQTDRPISQPTKQTNTPRNQAITAPTALLAAALPPGWPRRWKAKP